MSDKVARKIWHENYSKNNESISTISTKHFRPKTDKRLANRGSYEPRLAIIKY